MENKELTAKERVELELSELVERAEKLTRFLYGVKIIDDNKVSISMQGLMREQLNVMQKYIEILHNRLRIWGKTDEELRKIQPVYFNF